MEIKHLQEFVVLAETGNFMDAADQLYISQSSLSKHISHMEEELGVMLFDRTSRSAHLTEYGEDFYQHTQQTLRAYQASLRSLEKMQNEERQRMSIGFSAFLGQYDIIETSGKFFQEHQEWECHMIEIKDPQEALTSGRCDFVFAAEGAVISPDIRYTIFRRDHMAMMIPEGHPFESLDFVTINQLRDVPVICHESKSYMFAIEKDVLTRLCQEQGFSPNFVGTSSFTSTVARMVKSGQGLAPIYRNRMPSTDGVKLVDIYPEIPFNVCVYMLRSNKNKPAFTAFYDYIRSVSQ
ncbi:MAG: LysR family transcriptional regulator [Clostridia bacterium]|nr:LysR family transcriptional regulator [Clostridia bacterium]